MGISPETQRPAQVSAVAARESSTVLPRGKSRTTRELKVRRIYLVDSECCRDALLCVLTNPAAEMDETKVKSKNLNVDIPGGVAS